MIARAAQRANLGKCADTTIKQCRPEYPPCTDYGTRSFDHRTAIDPAR